MFWRKFDLCLDIESHAQKYICLSFLSLCHSRKSIAAFQTGLKLPGSRSDVVRTKSLSGPSPVGGAMGGFESNAVQSLDEFELQAAHYNMACAHARLGNIDDVSADGMITVLKLSVGSS